MQGLNFLVTNQLDLAIDEMGQAAALDPDALEIHMILGNLYREKGQVSRAVQIHQHLLQRPRLGRLEHTYVLLCLGLDYRRGGFIDRAIEAFQEVLRLDPDQRARARPAREALRGSASVDRGGAHPRAAHRDRRAGPAAAPPHHPRVPREPDRPAGAGGTATRTAAATHFAAAIEIDSAVMPAYVNLGDLRLAQRRHRRGHRDVGDADGGRRPSAPISCSSGCAPRTSTAGTPERFEGLCRRLIDDQPQDWRARLALAAHLRARGDSRGAFTLLIDALAHNPHAVSLHQATWETLVDLGVGRADVDRYMAVSREAVYYRDPHICLRCRYRSNELLWQCPHCHEWNTFVEERLAAAHDGERAEG